MTVADVTPMADGIKEEFNKRRSEGNDVVMRYAGKSVKRFYNIDSQVYDEGALPKKTKELIGLVSSLVLRCDDCIMYHLVQCQELGLSDQELEEAMAIGVVIGGTITIPHHRKALLAWDEMKQN